LLVLLFVFACKKTKNDPEAETPDTPVGFKKLKHRRTVTNGDTLFNFMTISNEQYNYDFKSRLASITITDSSQMNRYASWKFETRSLTFIRDAGGRISRYEFKFDTDIFLLNFHYDGRGFMDMYTMNGTGYADTIRFKKSGSIIIQEQGFPKPWYRQYYSANLDSALTLDTNGMVTNKTLYKYNSDRDKVTAGTYEDFPLVLSRFNELTRMTTIGSDNKETGHTDCIRKYNQEGYPIEEAAGSTTYFYKF